MMQRSEPKLKKRSSPLWLLVAGFLVFSGVFLALPGEGSAQDASALPEIARTVYVLPSNNDNPFPITAFVIFGDELIEAKTVWHENQDLPVKGPIGAVVDSDNGVLYVALENDPGVSAFDARTLEYLEFIEMPELTDPAGMDIDEERDRFYLMDRFGDDVVVYDTNSMTLIETWTLPTGGGAFGLTVLDDVIYVANGAPAVRYYDVDTHEELGSFDQTNLAIAVSAAAAPLPVVFSTNAQAGTIMTRYDVDTGDELLFDFGTMSKGLVADPVRRLVYALGGSGTVPESGVYVLDADTLEEIHQYPLGEGTWSGTDVALGNGDFGDEVAVAVTSPSDAVTTPGGTIAIDVTITNPGDKAIHLLPARVLFDDDLLDFASATPAQDAVKDASELEWSDLVTSFGEDLAPGASFVVQVNFQVEDLGEDIAVIPGTIVARMLGAQDVDGGDVRDAAGAASFAVTPEQADDDTDDDDADDDDAADDDDDDGCCGC